MLFDNNRFYSTIVSYFYVIFFFFKQKTAYEIASCLVGSEMCIRDRTLGYLILFDTHALVHQRQSQSGKLPSLSEF